MNRILLYGLLVLVVLAACELAVRGAVTRGPPPVPFVPQARTSPHAPRQLPCASWPRPKEPPPRCRCENACAPGACGGQCCAPLPCGLPK